METPPSRYRVIERGGRLVVLDSAVGGAPLTAKDLLPDMAPDYEVDPPSFDPAPDPEPIDDRDTPASEPGFAMLAPPPSFPRPVATRPMIAEPPGLLRNVAATICGDARDADGRLQWTTARWFDAKGPRTLTLSKRAEPQLGFAMLALLAAAVVAIILAVGMGFVGFVILFVAGSLLRQAKPIATAWIDRLALS